MSRTEESRLFSLEEAVGLLAATVQGQNKKIQQLEQLLGEEIAARREMQGAIASVVDQFQALTMDQSNRTDEGMRQIVEFLKGLK